MTILHLEDCAEDAELVGRLVRKEWPECTIDCVATRDGFIGAMQRWRYDLILSDFKLYAFNGLDALKEARKYCPETPFIFLSGTLGEDRAIEALRSGAQDYILKDGMKRLCSAIARALRDNEDRKKHEEAQRRIREQAEMLNQAREAIFITDLEERVIYWNAGAGRLFGSRNEEVIGRGLAELFAPETVAALHTAFAATIDKGEWSGEVRVLVAGRDPLIVESRHTLIQDENNRPKAQLCISSDITDRKRLEQQFLRAQRMENVGMLAAGIAHDLNNMLAPILLAAPMLREHLADPGALGLLSTLEKSAERGANLVRQILSFAHGASGEHRLLQVRHVLREIVSVITGTFPKSIRLEDFIATNLWPVEGNPTQIHQVLLNLCVNARDAMPDGGTLRLRAGNHSLDAAAAEAIPGGRPGDFVVLHVEDTGTGIPPEVAARMWEPFFTTKESDKGTGLGLSTVRGIVENHNGFIEFSSVPGRGSTFRIHLPAAEGTESEAAGPGVRSLARGRGELILVVDDEPRIRDMTFAFLTRRGYRVITAADGAEAADVFLHRAAEIRLVITDVQMPNLDGAALATALRLIKPKTRVLAISGMSPSHLAKTNRNPDDFADAFLPKPFKPETLLAKVHELLRGRDGGSATPFRAGT